MLRKNSEEYKNSQACVNTDEEVWRKDPDYYSPSIHMTKLGDIGINVGGYVIVASVESWHEAGKKIFTVDSKLRSWRKKLAFKLLGW